MKHHSHLQPWMTSLTDWTQLSWAYTVSLMKCSTFNQTNEPVSSWCWPECKCDSFCFCNCQKPFPSKFVTPTPREESSTDSKHCGGWIQQQQSYKQGKKYTWWMMILPYLKVCLNKCLKHINTSHQFSVWSQRCAHGGQLLYCIAVWDHAATSLPVPVRINRTLPGPKQLRVFKQLVSH